MLRKNTDPDVITKYDLGSIWKYLALGGVEWVPAWEPKGPPDRFPVRAHAWVVG